MTLAPFAVPEYTAADFSQETWWLSLIKAVFIIVFLIANVLLALWVERRGLGRMQTRPGPNVAGPLGLFQAFADAGKLLYKYAKEILQVRENAAIALRNFSQEMKGTISIAASTVPSQYYLPHLLQDFRARYPDITFNIQMEDSPKVVELVATRSVEIGFCGTMVASHKCVYQDFASDPMVLITPNTEKYQAFAGKPFPIEQLKEETFISREKGSGTYQAGKELLNELGIDIAQLRTAVEIRSTESVKQMVSEGLGVGLIAQSAAQDYVQFGKLLAFPFPDSRFRRQLYIVKHKNSILSPIAQVFYDYARKAKDKASAK